MMLQIFVDILPRGTRKRLTWTRFVIETLDLRLRDVVFKAKAASEVSMIYLGIR